MNVSFLKDDGDTISIDAPVDADLRMVMTSLEKVSGIPVTEQVISFDGRRLDEPKARISQLGVTQNSILSLQRRAQKLSVVTQDTRNVSPGSPYRVAPEPVKSAVDPPVTPLSYHRYGPVSQPDELEEVTMLYVPVEIKNHTVEAMVGCSVLYSTISPECAKVCGIMGDLDTRFTGIALGSATRILGRVRASLKVGDVRLDCPFLVVDGYDLLLGLDMLKANRACIDLEKGVLRINGCEVAFRDKEHSFPRQASPSRTSNEGERKHI